MTSQEFNWISTNEKEPPQNQTILIMTCGPDYEDFDTCFGIYASGVFKGKSLDGYDIEVTRDRISSWICIR